MRFKYTGPYNPDYDVNPIYDYIQFNEINHPIGCAFFLKHFDEYTDTDAFHKKLSDVVNDKVD